MAFSTSRPNIKITTSEGTYYIIKEAKTYSAAKAAAESDGGHLAAFETEAEYTALYNAIATEYASDSSWGANTEGAGGGVYLRIGGTDGDTVSRWDSSDADWNWKWITDNSEIAKTRPEWGEGTKAPEKKEPDNFYDGTNGSDEGGQDSLVMGLTGWGGSSRNKMGDAGEWNDERDSIELYYLVEDDTTAPTVTQATPADDSVDIALDSNFSATFDENVVVKTGNVGIYKTSDDSVFEVVDVTSSQVTGSGTKTLTLNPSKNFEENTSYYFLVAGTAIDDLAGNSFAAVTDKTTYNFTTVAPTPTISGVSSQSGNDTYSSGSTISIAVNFTGAVNVVTTGGTPTLELETGSVDRKATYSSGSGSDVLVFQYTVQDGDTAADLDYISTSALALNGGTIKDASGNDVTLTLSSPGASGSLGANAALIIDTTGPSAPSSLTTSSTTTNDTTPRIEGKADPNSTVKLYNGSTLLGSDLTDSNGDFFINTSALTEGSYSLTATATDSAGNISSKSDALSITIDTTAPTVTQANPADDSVNIALDSNFSATFSENVVVKTGNLGIYKTSDDSVFEVVDVTSSQVTGSGTKTLTLNPSKNFEESTSYYFLLDGTAVDDLAGNSFAAVTDKTEYNFTTSGINPTLSSSFPSTDSTAVAIASDIVLNFSEVVDVESGNIVIYKSSDSSVFESIDVTSSKVTGTGTNKITINPTSDFQTNTKYYLTISSTAFDDSLGNSYAGISDSTSLCFTTVKNITYSITPSASTIDEGDTLTTTISTTDVDEDTRLYWSVSGTGVSNLDFVTGDLVGSGLVGSNGKFTVTHKNAKDFKTEGDETLSFKLFSDKSLSTQLGETSTILINDSSTNKSYTTTAGKTIENKISLGSSEIVGDITFNRVTTAATITDKPAALDIGKTGINFSIKLDSTAVNNKSNITTDLAPLFDGLTTTGKNIAYFSYTETGDGSAPTATTLTYDPTKKAGARFYDLSGDGVADKVLLELVDGGYGDKDGVKNGTIVDPSTAGVVDLTPVFTATTTALTVADATDVTSPAAFNLNVRVSSAASTVNQIGYVALNANESDTLTYDLIKNRGSILLSNLENNDAPSVSGMNLTSDVNVINSQKVVFFEVVDTTLDALLAESTTLEGFGSNFNILNLSGISSNSASASNGGNTISISLQESAAGIDDLIASDQGFNPIIDLTGLAGLTLEGTISTASETSGLSHLGFYKIENANGAVKDPITGDLILPGTAGYREAATDASNLFDPFGTYSTSSNTNKVITDLTDTPMLALYANKDSTDAFFSFADANTDGMHHFRELGNGTIGYEDQWGGGSDKDFDDYIFGIDLELSSVS